MPLYEYECTACGKVHEVIQKFSDEPLKECSDCGGSLERLLSAPAIQFKGSGWYVTDYAGRGSDKESGSSDKKESSDSGKDKSESKEKSETSKKSKSTTSESSSD